MLRVKDVKTGAVYDVPLSTTATIVCRDGVRVRLHPNTVDLMVKRGKRFDGHTIKGTRLLERVK